MPQMKTLSAQQIQQIQQKVSGLRMLNGLNNPEGLLQMAAKQNPMISQALQLGKNNNGDYDSVTIALLRQNGYDPNAVRQQLHDAGII